MTLPREDVIDDIRIDDTHTGNSCEARTIMCVVDSCVDPVPHGSGGRGSRTGRRRMTRVVT